MKEKYEIKERAAKRMILEFDLPEEERAAVEALRAGDYASALYQIAQKLRSIRKYKDMDEKQNQLFVEIFEFFWSKVEGLNIES